MSAGLTRQFDDVETDISKLEENMKSSTLIIVSALALSLGACGATTGSLTQTMAQKAATTAMTQSVERSETVESETVTVDPFDASEDCEALTVQMAELDTTITDSQKVIESGGSNVAANVATTGVTHAALHAGAAGAIAKVPFGGFLAKSAMDAPAKAAKKRVKKAEKALKKAELKKAQLVRPIEFLN